MDCYVRVITCIIFISTLSFTANGAQALPFYRPAGELSKLFSQPTTTTEASASGTSDRSRSTVATPPTCDTTIELLEQLFQALNDRRSEAQIKRQHTGTSTVEWQVSFFNPAQIAVAYLLSQSHPRATEFKTKYDAAWRTVFQNNPPPIRAFFTGGASRGSSDDTLDISSYPEPLRQTLRELDTQVRAWLAAVASTGVSITRIRQLLQQVIDTTTILMALQVDFDDTLDDAIQAARKAEKLKKTLEEQLEKARIIIEEHQARKAAEGRL